MSFLAEMINSEYIFVFTFTSVVMVVAVMLHYEVSVLLTRWVATTHLTHRRRILMLVFGLLILHIVEIWLFGGAAWFLVTIMKSGVITNVLDQVDFDFLDFVYFSAVTYTTVGYGDLWPIGPVRFLYGAESLIGLVLITWSASLTFIEMQRHWRIYNTDG